MVRLILQDLQSYQETILYRFCDTFRCAKPCFGKGTPIQKLLTKFLSGAICVNLNKASKVVHLKNYLILVEDKNSISGTKLQLEKLVNNYLKGFIFW